MAALTWKNINAPTVSTAGTETALRALTGAGKSFEGAAGELQAQETARRSQRTSDAIQREIQGLTTLEDVTAAQSRYATPGVEETLGDIDIDPFRKALAGRGAEIQADTTAKQAFDLQ